MQVDQNRIRQVVNNLLSNALKYSPEETEIEVVVTYLPEKARLQVLDRGPGVDANTVNELFELFVRDDYAKTSGIPGAGIGLSITKRIVDAHNGTLSLDAREGGGTIATVELPISD